MAEPRLRSYRAFWPLYVGEHRRPLTRRLHFFGTLGAIGCIAAAAALAAPWLLPLALLMGYGFAWVGHFFVEKNRPATLRYPLWSLIADFHMFALMLAGRMDAEARRVEAGARAERA